MRFTRKKVILRSIDSNSRSQIATECLSKTKQPNDQYVRTNARFTRVCVKETSESGR